MSADQETGWHSRNRIGKQVEAPGKSIFERNRETLAETQRIARETRKATERILKD